MEELFKSNDIIKSISVLFGTLYLFFRFIDSFQDKSLREKSQKKFKKIWKTIENSGLLQLSEFIIKDILKIKSTFTRVLVKIRRNNRDGFVLGIFLIIIINGICFGKKLEAYLNLGIWTYLITLSCPLIVLSYSNYITKLLGKSRKVFDSFVYILFAIYCFIGNILLLDIVLEQQILITLFSLIILLPFLYLNYFLSLIIVPMIYVNDFDKASIIPEKTYSEIVFGLAVSYTITLLGFLIGTYFAPDNNLPRTLQLFLINSLFDLLTVFTTFYLLKWSIKSNHSVRVFIAIFLDLVLSAIFAVLSLFLGLLNTPYAISLESTLNVVIGKSSNGEFFELGAHFWIMHTTFIPTIILILVLFISLVGKYLTFPVMTFFKRSSVSEKPFIATANTFALTGGLFLLLHEVLKWFYS